MVDENRLCQKCQSEIKVFVREEGSDSPLIPTSAACSIANDQASRRPVLEDYQIRSALGGGKMGTVYLAFEPRLNRMVALKMPLAEYAAKPGFAKDFLQEARAAAAAVSDHIVKIHSSGDNLPGFGLPYLVMEYIEGKTLQGRMEGGRTLPPIEAAEITRQVALGLAAIHSLGLVHRDIQPSNIIIESSTGRAKLMDFGLAREADSPDPPTDRSEKNPARPTYPSADFLSDNGIFDARGDLYDLGASLYEALTGTTPFEGSSEETILRWIASHDPSPPRAINRSVPRDLEAICLKCLEKEPSRRYQSAVALAEDLRRFLNHEPTEARPVLPLERILLWAFREPWAASFLVGCAIGAITIAWLLRS